MNEQIQDTGFEDVRLRQDRELSRLFGDEIVNQARLIDVVDLNLNDQMTRCISDGVKQLKKLKGQPDSQKQLIAGMDPGERLLLCMWIMEMELLDKLLDEAYLE